MSVSHWPFRGYIMLMNCSQWIDLLYDLFHFTIIYYYQKWIVYYLHTPAEDNLSTFAEGWLYNLKNMENDSWHPSNFERYCA